MFTIGGLKNTVSLSICLFFLQSFALSQKDTISSSVEDTIAQRIVLIGDAGQLTNGKHPVVDAVRKLIKLDKKTTVLFLGDNLYKIGLPDDQNLNYELARAVLDSQLSVADSTDTQVYMVPGNHDWENGGRGGFEAIIRQQLYVDFLGKNNVEYYPKDGCPGPVEISLGKDVTLILFDSQWWIHPFDKPEIESDCNCKTKEELTTQIGDIAARNSKKLIIIGCHHPFKSNGMHGGFYTLKQHLFPLTDLKKNLYIPLPIIGSAYPIARSVFGTPQDLKHPNYANMVSEITDVVKASAPNVVFVSGHDHNLQHIIDSSYNYIVSGGGCKQNRTSKNKNSLYNSSSQGFSVMEVSTNKNVTVDFYTVTDSIRKEYTATMLNFSSIPEVALDSAAVKIEDPFLKYKDTTTVPASNDFPLIDGLKKFFMGQNYRAAWSQPVNMKVFNVLKEKGGFDTSKITFGGGKQTKSLRLVNKKTGQEWVLRSMNKNPTKAIPEAFRGTLAGDLVTELNSAAHPYAALTVPDLADAIGVNVPHPELFFVPDDPALGFYRELFANNICMLEERNVSVNNVRSTDSIKIKTETTAKVFAQMLDENDHQTDQSQVLRARLLDILIGDFDRHFDQWRWGTIDSTKGKSVKGKIYHPIPRDRDQTFFYSDGVILRLASRRAMPFLKGFRHTIPQVEWLGYSARDFDRIFLTDLDATEWSNIITELQTKWTDTIIRTAVKKLPPEVYGFDGETIVEKLISRRNLLAAEGMKYYHFISKEVNIVGSNQKEYFKVSNSPDGLHIRVYARSKGNDTSFIKYDRTFKSSETREIRLFGLNDDDKFDIEENVSTRIKLRIIGGKGNDTFDIKGGVENLLYDLVDDGNFIKNGKGSKVRFSRNPPVNDRNILGFNYNTTKLPQLYLNYNSDDALVLGAGISRRTQGFRNLPYATEQRLSILYAPYRHAYQFRYHGEFNHITRDIDLVADIRYSHPALRNFFGLGNNTEVDESKKFTYYQTRYQFFELQALVRKRLFDKIQVMGGPWYYTYNSNFRNNRDNILGAPPAHVSVDSANVFSKKSYLGAKFALYFDNRNNELFPTRGLLWYNDLVASTGITPGSRNYMSFTSDMSIFASFSDPAKIVMVLRAGGGHIFNKNYEYFQALSIGLNNNLFGFRKNRYSGNSAFYGSMELRAKLFNINSYVLPGAFGLTGFYSLGRVWLREERSKRWHGGYGGGFYFLPFNLFMITATAGFSDSEKVYNFTLGTKINLNY